LRALEGSRIIRSSPHLLKPVRIGVGGIRRLDARLLLRQDDRRQLVVDGHRLSVGDRALGHLPRQRAIAFGAPRLGVVDGDGLAEARRLAEPHGPRDDDVVDAIAEIAANLADDLLGQLRPRVEHRHDDARQPKRRVDVLLDEADVVEQLTEPFEGVVLALDGDDELLRGRERVDREEPERGRTVEEDEVVGAGGSKRLQRPAKPKLPGELADQLDLSAGQVDRRRDREQAPNPGGDDGILDRRPLVGQDVIDGHVPSIVLDTHSGGGISLGIEVDHQDAMTQIGEGGSQADRGRAFAHAPLLIGDRDHPRPRSLLRR
jgi:hypothetical protein